MKRICRNCGKEYVKVKGVSFTLYCCEECREQGELAMKRERAKVWYRENWDDVKAYRQSHYQQCKQATQKWAKAHPDAIKAIQKRNYEKNKKKILERARKRYLARKANEQK